MASLRSFSNIKNMRDKAEAIPRAQRRVIYAMGIPSKIDRLFFKMNFFGMTLLLQNKN